MSDLGQERLVDRLFAHIEKHGKDERLRELAADVRRGNASLRDYLNTSEYSQALQPRLEDFAGWYEQLSDAERAEQAERCQREIDSLSEAETSGQEF